MHSTWFIQAVKKITEKGVSVFFCLALLVIGLPTNSVVLSKNVNAAKPQIIDGAEVCTEQVPDNLGAAALSGSIWKHKSVLRVRFLDGSEFLRGRVRYYAQFWSNHANIQFEFVEIEPSDIRVSFSHDGGSWSYIGNSAKYVDESEPTMNFGWFDDNTSEVKFRRTILHEFGHALGLVHEHQSPVAGINWNKSAVYRYYKNKFGWNKNVVNDNIFQKYTGTRTQHTTYDPDSIMHYPIPAEFTTDGSYVSWNMNLSQMDIALIKKLYPRRGLNY
jgi:hypothetical protein